jgi:hypothetical protein
MTESNSSNITPPLFTTDHFPVVASRGVWAVIENYMLPKRSRYELVHVPSGQMLYRMGSRSLARDALQDLAEHVLEWRKEAGFDADLRFDGIPLHHSDAQTFLRHQRSVQKSRSADIKRDPGATAPKGMVKVLDGDNGARFVKNLGASGLYVVTQSAKGDYRVTHAPTGFVVSPKFNSAQEAAACARHMHQHAPEAGSGTPFGQKPPQKEIDAMSEALHTWPDRWWGWF